jgi:lysophospholipase L1-like esterase
MLSLAAACSERVPPLPELEPDHVVVAFGNSLTHGTGAGRDESYPDVLGRLINRKVVNAGKPGELSAEGLKRLPSALARHDPALILLCHGGNDMLRKKSSEAMADNLRQMIALSRTEGVPVVLVGVPRPGLWLSPAEQYDTIAEELGIPYEGEVLSTVLGDNLLKSDLIHPNAEGYRQVAEALATLLQRVGAVPEPEPPPDPSSDRE